jgi:ESS family glutamate:Na+ symporter
MILSGWWMLLLAVPVLLLGELAVGRVPGLAKLYLPAPIVGGLAVAVAVLAINLARPGALSVRADTAARAWTWLITPEVTWLRSPPKVTLFAPLMVAFFTCVGLNASWAVARAGSWRLLVLLAVATVLAVVQNVAGVAMARAMHVSPFVGLLCGSVTLTGGPGTAMGFADSFERAGFAQARAVGLAAAMFGIVTASLVGGPLGGGLIRAFRLRATGGGSAAVAARPVRPASPFLAQLRAVAADPWPVVAHLLLLAACIKVGAWVSYGLASRLTFPTYIGALVVGIVVRNASDLARRPFVRTATVSLIAAVLLAVYLTVAVMTLDLMQLRSLAGPMLVILLVQVAIMLVFAAAVTFPTMAMDYEAAVASAGHVGFGLGITPNAVANMEALVEPFGPAPRAMLVVTLVGGFLIDVTNSATIVFFLNRLR